MPLDGQCITSALACSHAAPSCCGHQLLSPATTGHFKIGLVQEFGDPSLIIEYTSHYKVFHARIRLGQNTFTIRRLTLAVPVHSNCQLWALRSNTCTIRRLALAVPVHPNCGRLGPALLHQTRDLSGTSSSQLWALRSSTFTSDA